MSNDHWSNADAYERFMGRWSRNLGPRFIAWLDVPTARHWLEIGCGTGSLTKAIYDMGHPASVTAVDTAADFVAYCGSHLSYPSLRVLVASTDDLPSRRGGYDAVVSSLVLNFLPDAVDALRKMRFAASPNGCVAACVWDYSEGMEFLRLFWDAAIATDVNAAIHDEAVRFPLCSPAALRSAFNNAGFARIEVTSLATPTVFSDFADYWSSLSQGTGPAPSYLASLSHAKREALAQQLRALVQPKAGEVIHLNARAWAIRGAP